MTQDERRRILRYAALPLSLLICGGMYFGARAISDSRFLSAKESASDMDVCQKDGLWSYNSLSAREQQLYRVLSEAMDARNEMTARVTFVPTQNEFTAAFDAVLNDHPLYCDLMRQECVLLSADHSAQISLAYLPDGGARRAVLENKANEFLTAGASPDEKTTALRLHDMLTASCSYPSQTEQGKGSVGGTAYDALVVGESDAVGYALAYSLLCRTAGIECAVVTGTVDSGGISGMHAWNVLTLDGITGYTDSMWNDTARITDGGEDAAAIPFHGYYFLSADEIAAEHTPIDSFFAVGDTQNYYEQRDVCAYSEEELAQLLSQLLAEARRGGSDTVELWIDPQLNITGYALEEMLLTAIAAANTDETADAPQLRYVNRVYHTAVGGGGITVQLFYEKNNDHLGET